MFGAVCGDIIGSAYERHPSKNYHFPLFTQNSTFTDDTVLTLAVCRTLLRNWETSGEIWSDHRWAEEYALEYKRYYRRYPGAGFGMMFRDWACRDSMAVQSSYGNGGAMRVIPIAYAYKGLEQVLQQAKLSCWYTHAHPEAINAAQAVAAAAYLALQGESKPAISMYIERQFAYNLSVPLKTLQFSFRFDSRSVVSVPPSIIAFLESDSYEDAVRKAVSMGGDSDTMACIAGGIAEAYYGGIPSFIAEKCWDLLDIPLRTTAQAFLQAFPGACTRKIQ